MRRHEIEKRNDEKRTSAAHTGKPREGSYQHEVLADGSVFDGHREFVEED